MPDSGPSVLYLIDSLAAGGAEKSLVDVAPGLVSRGIRLSVAVLIDRGGLAPELEYRDIPVHRIGGGTRREWLGRVSRLLRSEQPDLVHTTLFESDVVGRVAAFRTGIPAVSTLATTPYGSEHAREAGVRWSRLRGAQIADAVTARYVSRFHAVSHSVAEACTAKLRLRPDRVDVIPRGRSRLTMGYPGAERRERARLSLGLPASAPVVLFAGRQEPAKGLDVLIGAFRLVRQRVPDAVLLVAGREGRATPQVQAMLAVDGAGEAVRVLGERSDVPDLLCAADVFVLPSYREGLPGAVLEAMAMRVPVVASDIPAVREAVPDELHAFLVPAGDPVSLAEALCLALTTPDESAGRADRAVRRFEERFEIGAVAEAMVGFYGRALRRPG